MKPSHKRETPKPGEKEVAMVVLWRGGELIIEERWEDVQDGTQETRYAFPGGKIENGEDEAQAAIREVHEETGVELQVNQLIPEDPITVRGKKCHVFRALLPYGTETGDGSIVIWTPQDLLEHKLKGKLMPFTASYVERELIFTDGAIDH